MFNSKKLALLATSGMLATGLVVGGATYALFTSSTTNSNNSFKAGTVNLNVMRDNGDPVPGPMFYPDSLDPLAHHPYDKNDVAPSGEAIGGWAPGDTVQREMYLGNSGTLTAKLTGIRAKVRSSYTQTTTTEEGGTAINTVDGVTLTSDPAAYNEFINKMRIVVKNGTVKVFEGKLSELLTGDTAWKDVENKLIIQSSPSGPLNLSFVATLSNDAGNIIQGKNFIFDFEFFATQNRNTTP